MAHAAEETQSPAPSCLRQWVAPCKWTYFFRGRIARCGSIEGSDREGFDLRSRTIAASCKAGFRFKSARRASSGHRRLVFSSTRSEIACRVVSHSLGSHPNPDQLRQQSWHTQAGTTAFAPFPQTTQYFGEPSQVWMVNFRVRDLDKMTAQLRSAGIEVKVDPEHYPNGRFARIHDPEGNPVELWEPAGQDASHD